jgi:hypothetical protein
MSTKTHKKLHKRRSIQETYIRVREASDDILYVADASSPTKRRYLAILQIEGTNYALKSQDDQYRITAQFRQLLAGLKFPLQILIRILPLDLKPYLEQFDEEETDSQSRQKLKQAHREHVRKLEGERGGLLSRQFYIILAANAEPNELLPGLFGRMLRSRKKRQAHRLEALRHAQQQLNIRCQDLTRQLNRMKVHAHRLTATELRHFYYSCAMTHRPEPSESLFEGLNRPTQSTYEHTLSDLQESMALPEIRESVETGISAKAQRNNQRKLRHENPLPNFSQLADLVSPAGMKRTASEFVCFDGQEEHVKGFIISNLAYELPVCWLRPLIDIEEPYVDICLHLYPVPASSALSRLRETHNTYQAKRIYAQKKGTTLDPHTEVEGNQVSNLLPKIASGEEQMFDVSLYVQCRATTSDELEQRAQRILALLRGMQLAVHPATFLHDDVYRSCLPEASNPAGVWGMLFLDSSSLATFFPFLSHTLYMPDGVMVGISDSNEPIVLNRWSQTNANCLYIGPSGAGKSYAKKCEIERLWLLKQQRQFLIMDPEREFEEFCKAADGQWIRLAPGTPHRINLFDTHPEQEPASWMPDERGDPLAEKIQSLREIFQIMLARKLPGNGLQELSPELLGYLEQVLFEAYRRVGITNKSTIHGQRPPLLRDVYDIIEKGTFGEDKYDLLPRLYPYVHGSHKSFFDGPTNVQLDNAVVVFDTRDLDTELTPIALAMIAEYVWTQSFHSLIPREFVIDEAGALAGYEAWARFMASIISRARKHYLAVSLMAQSAQSFPSSLAKVVATNCATIVPFGHPNTQSLRDLLELSENEAEYLETCGPGEGMIITANKRMTVRFVANELEHRLNSTNPVEVARWRTEAKEKHATTEIEQK